MTDDYPGLARRIVWHIGDERAGGLLDLLEGWYARHPLGQTELPFDEDRMAAASRLLLAMSDALNDVPWIQDEDNEARTAMNRRLARP